MLKYLAGYAKEHLLPEAAKIWNKKITLAAQENEKQDNTQSQPETENNKTTEDNKTQETEPQGKAPAPEDELS